LGHYIAGNSQKHNPFFWFKGNQIRIGSGQPK
jgi:hypothetical protein